MNFKEQVQKYSVQSKERVKKYAEVFTPFSLIDEMMDKLPEDVWNNPDLKWLDPANGVGNFPAVIVQRLMEGLKDHFPDEQERYKYIMENMIHVCEIQDKNICLYQMIFNPDNKFKLNIHNGSFLENDFEESMKKWNVDKFDIVVGNPPYQNDQKFGEKRGGGSSLWNKFVEKDLNLLNKEGFLVQVHPCGWRSNTGRYSSVKDILTQYNMTYLEIHNIDDGKKIFNAGTRYDWYVLEKTPYSGNTHIIDEEGIERDIDITQIPFIPNCYNDEVFSLLAKKDEETVEILHSYSAYEDRKRWINKKKTKEFKFPVIKAVNTKSEINLCWSNTKSKGMYGIPKVIFGRRKCGTFIDYDGKYALNQDVRAIVDNKKNLENINKALSSNKWDKIISQACKLTSTTGDRFNKDIMALFKKDFWKEFV